MSRYVGISPAAWDRIPDAERARMRAVCPRVPELTEEEACAGTWSGERLIVAEVTLVRLDLGDRGVIERSMEVCYSLDPEGDEPRIYVAISDGDSTDSFDESAIGPGQRYRRLDVARYEVWSCDHEAPHRDTPTDAEAGIAAPAAPGGTGRRSD